MSTTQHHWPPSHPDPLQRPVGYETFRQILARTQGNTHFQLATNAMAAPSPNSSRTVTAVNSYDTAPHLLRHCFKTSVQHSPAGHLAPNGLDDLVEPISPRLTRRSAHRGRSPTRRHLWAYSPERAHAEVQEEERRLSLGRTSYTDAQVQSPSTCPAAVDYPPGLVASAPVPDANGTAVAPTPSSSSIATSVSGSNHYEPPPVTNTCLPILSRPPASLQSPTSLEIRAWQSQETPGEGELSYLRAVLPASLDEGDEKSTSTTTSEKLYLASGFAEVLYTRSHLPDLDLPSRYLWHALHNFRVQNQNYAKGYAEHAAAKHALRFDAASTQACPFLSAANVTTTQARSGIEVLSSTFNWASLHLPLNLAHTWYGVTFRSIRRPSSLSLSLYRADRLSHEEAVTSGGLILYWYGEPDPSTGENLATCIWTSREAARVASALPLHREARDQAKDAYQSFELDRYRVVKRGGEKGLRVEAWI